MLLDRSPKGSMGSSLGPCPLGVLFGLLEAFGLAGGFFMKVIYPEVTSISLFLVLIEFLTILSNS